MYWYKILTNLSKNDVNSNLSFSCGINPSRSFNTPFTLFLLSKNKKHFMFILHFNREHTAFAHANWRLSSVPRPISPTFVKTRHRSRTTVADRSLPTSIHPIKITYLQSIIIRYLTAVVLHRNQHVIFINKTALFDTRCIVVTTITERARRYRCYFGRSIGQLVGDARRLTKTSRASGMLSFEMKYRYLLYIC